MAESEEPPAIPETLKKFDPPTLAEKLVNSVPPLIQEKLLQDKSAPPTVSEQLAKSESLAIPELSDITLQCSLCQDTLQEPKLLPCLHTFCRIPCLERIVVNNNGRQSLTCPTCQCIVPLTDGSVARLQTDFHVENVLKRQEAQNKSKKTEHNCQNCEKSPVVTYCQECKIIMCEKCQEMHQMWRDFSEHKLMNLNDTSNSSHFMDILSAAKCEEHKKREAIIFCETCSELICGDCAVIQHKGHLYNLIDDVFSRHKEEFTSNVKTVQEMMTNIQEALCSFSSCVEEINDQRATLEADICRDIDQLHQILDQRKEELLAILKQSNQQKLSDLAAQREEVEMTHTRTSRCWDYATGCLQAEQKDEVLRMKAPVLKRIAELEAKFDLSIKQPRIKADTRYISNDRARQDCKEFGDIVCESQTNTLENSYVDPDNATYEVVQNPLYQPVSYDNKKPSRQVEQKCSPATPVEESRAASSPINCKRLEKPERVVKGLRGLAGVAINSRQQIIVIDDSKHKMILMTSTGKKISSFGKQGSGKGKFKQPSGVTVDNHDYIYVTDCSNHCIQRFTSDGGFITAVGNHGRGRLQFIFPTGICFNKMNHLLYVCDQGNHRIQVLTTDLTIVKSISSPGGGNGKLNYPTSCAFDSSNNLYVADCRNNCVQVFTSEGEFLSAFTNNYSLEKPFAIAVDDNDNVYVSERNKDQIIIFSVKGDFVSSFGVRGSKEGQFQDIRNIFFNGSNNTFILVISDFLNNRIQIFLV